MNYCKPTVLGVVEAHHAIQTGAFGGLKIRQVNPDNNPMNQVRSTSGAYDADE